MKIARLAVVAAFAVALLGFSLPTLSGAHHRKGHTGGGGGGGEKGSIHGIGSIVSDFASGSKQGRKGGGRAFGSAVRRCADQLKQGTLDKKTQQFCVSLLGGGKPDSDPGGR